MQMKKLSQFFSEKVLPPLLAYILYAICMTLRIKVTGREKEQEYAAKSACIYTSWHGDLFLLPYLYRWDENLKILVSPSKDGDFVSNISLWLGFGSVRGSSHKNPVKALYGLKKLLDNGQSIYTVADGSRGPRHTLQQGAPLLARMTGKPLFFLSVHFSHKITFRSWDRFSIPLPFSEARVSYSEPLLIPPGISGENFREKCKEIEQICLDITETNRMK